MNLEFSAFITTIRSILLIIAAILFVIASIGILRIKKDQQSGIYAKLMILGVVDMAGILAMVALDQIFLAALYFILTPVIAHTMGNAFYYGEDTENHNDLDFKNNSSLNKLKYSEDDGVYNLSDSIDSQDSEIDDSVNTFFNIDKESESKSSNNSKLESESRSNNDFKLESESKSKSKENSEKLTEDKFFGHEDDNYTISTLKIRKDGVEDD